MTDLDIDKIARHLREHSPPWFPRKEKWEKLEERAREEWRKQARAAVAEIERQMKTAGNEGQS